MIKGRAAEGMLTECQSSHGRSGICDLRIASCELRIGICKFFHGPQDCKTAGLQDLLTFRLSDLQTSLIACLLNQPSQPLAGQADLII